MSVWAGYWGPGNGETLRAALGPDAQLHLQNCCGLGVRQGPGRLATLDVSASGRVTAVVGSHPEACSSVSIDSAEQTLTLARDPFGFHGVFTAQVGEALWFSSDPRLLAGLPGVERHLDPLALHGYLCFSYVPSPLTVFPHVAALPIGDTLLLTPDGNKRVSENRWHESEHLTLGEEEAASRLRALLRAAVARRLGDEREVGVFLSGGIDSSLIVALLLDAGVRVRLFTLDFGPPFDAEMPYARRVAEFLGQRLDVVQAHPEKVRTALRGTAAALQQPFGDGVTVPLYLLGKAASEQVSVVFNGEGGDQLFGGWANKPIVAAELYGGEGYDREAAYLGTYHRFHGLTDQLYIRQARAEVGEVDAGAWVRPFLDAEGFTSLIHRLRAANLWLKGAQNIAPRAAQLAAAHGLRMHAPFFDRELAEWTFSLPPELLMRGACEKYLLKRAAEPFLPPEVVWREKRGMGVPTTGWCLGPLRREVGRWLDKGRLRRDGRFEPTFVEALRRGENQPGEYRWRRLGEKLWTLLMLEVWRDAQKGVPA